MKQANAGVQDRGGETALHRAVLGGHVEAVLALVYEHSNPVIDVRYEREVRGWRGGER